MLRRSCDDAERSIDLINGYRNGPLGCGEASSLRAESKGAPQALHRKRRIIEYRRCGGSTGR